MTVALNTYNNGQPYRTARGQVAQHSAVVDHNTTVHPIVSGFPTPETFHRSFVRELKIRCYQPRTIHSYGNILSRFLRWFGNMPHRVSIEDVRCFLEDLVDGGAKSDWVSQHLAVLRTAFDKFNGRQVTLGLATPRKPKRLPSVLSEDEVKTILKAASSLRDKLLIGLMYATGMRISEVTRLRWQDFDFDRGIVNVWQAKGRSDRQVTLPQSFKPLLLSLSGEFPPTAFVFPGERTGRHISPRTGERIVSRTAQLAGVRKKVTPHSFRHAFATHLLENGTDIRFIQKLLGHVRLETTTIYTRVAVPKEHAVASPLDRIETTAPLPPKQSVGGLQITLKNHSQNAATFAVKICSNFSAATVLLEEVILEKHGPGWISMQLPASEHWQHQLGSLDRQCRERVESAQFYQSLQKTLTGKFQQLIPG